MQANPIIRTYQRKRWKHYIRYVALLIFLFADCGFVVPLVRVFTLPNPDITTRMLLKQLVAYLLLIFCNVAVLPSIVMEADKVEVSADGVTFHNLLFWRKLKWSDIRSVTVPTFLKFAIIRTGGFFQLISKYDIPDFNDLIQTIQTKTEQAQK